ncbi:SET domain-containing protein [Trichoderma breve]|uniref:SET domain-containing protein n=1 Tax=Trichoderma breve TaxID=2034170 RepID=A0A9W9B715_9HYPO|nr:SET domain-containing protein [Trichoderma breve]KAJ4855834.1 SET domain-containing protein [Trichoderma breve]
MEAVTGQHFFFHDQPEHAAEKDSCHFCQLRAFPIHQTTPVTIVNAKDQAVIPPNFRFIDRMVLGQGVEPAEDSFRSGCSCESDSECQYMGCLCLADLGEEEDSSSNEDEDIHANGANGDGPEAGRKDKMLNSKEPLYECHAGCSCSKDCPNRVVERGRTIPLQIFRTDDRGWGVRTQVAIKKGQFVDRYLGEIITSAEADRRRAASAVSKRKDVYLFALDKFTHPESLDPRLKGPPLEVDGEFLSGPTRFINHSCEPNLRIFARVGDHADKHIHDLALFAIRDIPRGEELTFDYVDGVTEDGGGMEGASAGDMAKCLFKREFLFGGSSTPLASTQRNATQLTSLRLLLFATIHHLQASK